MGNDEEMVKESKTKRMDAIAAKEFENRRYGEGHALEQYQVFDPKTTLVQMLATGFFRNQYYMDKGQILAASVAAHADCIDADEEFHMRSVLEFRETAWSKDQAILGAIMRNEFGDEIRKVA